MQLDQPARFFLFITQFQAFCCSNTKETKTNHSGFTLYPALESTLIDCFVMIVVGYWMIWQELAGGWIVTLLRAPIASPWPDLYIEEAELTSLCCSRVHGPTSISRIVSFASSPSSELSPNYSMSMCCHGCHLAKRSFENKGLNNKQR